MSRPNKIWYRKDIGWWMITLEGRKIRLAQGRSNKKAAEKKFHELKAAQGDFQLPETLCVADIIDAFLTWAKANRSPETVRNYLWYGQMIADYIGDLPVSDLRPYLITEWVGKHQWNPSTEHNARRSVYRAFSWAVEEGLLRSNPLQGMKCPMTQARQRGMTDQEFRMLLKGSKYDFKVLLFTLRMTGCRPKEARELTWDQVADDRILLQQHKTIRKTRKIRVIYLPIVMQKLFKLMHKRRGKINDKSQRVFLNSQDQPWTVEAMRLRLRRLKKKYSLSSDLSIYHARHAFGTSAIVNGIDPLTVAQLMGHTSVSMVQRFYAHLGNESMHLKQAAERSTHGIGNSRRSSSD